MIHPRRPLPICGLLPRTSRSRRPFPNLVLPDIEEQFTYESCKRQMNTEIRRLDDLAGFDAVYIATGAGGECFGLTRDTGGAFASNKPGIFLGGALAGSDSVSSIADGLYAVHAVERYLKIREMNQPPENPTARIKLDPSALSPEPPVIPAQGAAYTKEEASAEAARCIRCACDSCLRAGIHIRGTGKRASSRSGNGSGRQVRIELRISNFGLRIGCVRERSVRALLPPVPR